MTFENPPASAVNGGSVSRETRRIGCHTPAGRGSLAVDQDIWSWRAAIQILDEQVWVNKNANPAVGINWRATTWLTI